MSHIAIKKIKLPGDTELSCLIFSMDEQRLLWDHHYLALRGAERTWPTSGTWLFDIKTHVCADYSRGKLMGVEVDYWTQLLVNGQKEPVNLSMKYRPDNDGLHLLDVDRGRFNTFYSKLQPQALFHCEEWVNKFVLLPYAVQIGGSDDMGTITIPRSIEAT